MVLMKQDAHVGAASAGAGVAAAERQRVNELGGVRPQDCRSGAPFEYRCQEREREMEGARQGRRSAKALLIHQALTMMM